MKLQPTSNVKFSLNIEVWYLQLRKEEINGIYVNNIFNNSAELFMLLNK